MMLMSSVQERAEKNLLYDDKAKLNDNVIQIHYVGFLQYCSFFMNRDVENFCLTVMFKLSFVKNLSLLEYLDAMHHLPNTNEV